MFYNTNHPDEKAHGGIGILIKNRIKRHFYNTFATNYLITCKPLLSIFSWVVTI